MFITSLKWGRLLKSVRYYWNYLSFCNPYPIKIEVSKDRRSWSLSAKKNMMFPELAMRPAIF